MAGGARSDVERVLALIARRADDGGVTVNALLGVVDGDRDRLDRALAALDERGVVAVFGGLHTGDARAVLRRRSSTAA